MQSKATVQTEHAPRPADPDLPSFLRSGNFRGFLTQIPSGLWAISRIPRAQGRGKIFRLYLKLIAKLYASSLSSHGDYSEENVLGSRMRVLDYRAFVDVFSEIFVRRDYFFEAGSPAPFILDCGSNIGMSVLFFKQLYPASRIIAFEPDRETFDVLQSNVQKNQLENVELHNQAIYPTDGCIEFFSDPSHPGSLAMSTARERFPGRVANSHKVEAVRLSPFIEGEVDLLKMDIEGAELSVVIELAASGKLKWIQQMFIEYHHHMKPAEDHLSQLFCIFEENGFGYQIHCPFRRPFAGRVFQDIQIYAYRRA
jgi:FkbM family methyltransferase